MPKSNRGNQVISGSDCIVWINNQIWDDVKSVEYKIAGEFEDIVFLGDPRTYKKYTGFGGEGTLILNKIRSRGASILADAFRTGNMPDIKIVLKVTNRSTGRSERVALYGVVFTEFGGSFADKALAEEELPFTFSDFEVLETL
jgi:hypothetical protein